MTFIPDATLQQAVAGALKKTWASSPTPQAGDLSTTTYWAGIVTYANIKAYGDIVTRLATRGYDYQTQILLWDRGIEYNTSLGIYWALVQAGQFEAFDPKFVQMYDQRGELGGIPDVVPIPVTVNYQVVFPLNPIVATTGPLQGATGFGPTWGENYNPNGWRSIDGFR